MAFIILPAMELNGIRPRPVNSGVRQLIPMMRIATISICSMLLVVCCSASLSHAQAQSDDGNLYQRALFASLAKMQSEWGKLDDTVLGTRIPTNYHAMIVLKNDEITKDLSSQNEDYRVDYLDDQGLIDRYKQLRKQFAILVTYPMTDDGPRIKVSFNVYWISYGKGRLIFGLSTWSNVFFRYECDAKRYVIDDIKLGGI